MFQREPEEHSSLKQFAITPEPISSFLSKPSLIRRMAKELPHIGWDRSKDIEKEFGTARELCRVLAEGERERLLDVDGVGKKIATDILESIDKDEREKRG
jgi:endonuclease III